MRQPNVSAGCSQLREPSGHLFHKNGPRRWKREDLPTLFMVRMVWQYRLEAIMHLINQVGILRKVVLAAVERDVELGYLEYGVSPLYPWVTRDPQAVAKELAGKQFTESRSSYPPRKRIGKFSCGKYFNHEPYSGYPGVLRLQCGDPYLCPDCVTVNSGEAFKFDKDEAELQRLKAGRVSKTILAIDAATPLVFRKVSDPERFKQEREGHMSFGISVPAESRAADIDSDYPKYIRTAEGAWIKVDNSIYEAELETWADETRESEISTWEAGTSTPEDPTFNL